MKILITAEHLAAVLNALNGPAHHIRELQATRGPLVGDDNPINLLVTEYNDAVKLSSVMKDKARQESEAQAEGRLDCHAIDAQCDYYSYQCGSNGELVSSLCKHPENIRNIEGNCLKSLCPLTK